MSEEQRIKEQCMKMAATDLATLLTIIGDLGYVGYKIAMCRLKGNSYLQCGSKFGISKSLAQWHWNNCIKKGYDIKLTKIFNIEKSV